MSADKRPKESDVIEIAGKIYLETEKESGFKTLISTPLGDDCFSFSCLPDRKIAVTADALFEGVHFDLNFFSFYEVGYRSVAVNLSDLASQGAHPAFVFVTAGFKKGTELEDIKSFMEGIRDACLEYGCVLAGGDTNSAKTFSVSVTAIGFSESEMKRSNAKPGDLICVTGSLGLAAAGYFVLKRGLSPQGFESAVERFLKPKARVAEGIVLSQAGVRCCEDISDGLLRDLINVAARSGVGFEIDLERVPVAKEVFRLCKLASDLNPYEVAFAFGDDYELLFTAGEMTVKALKQRKLDFKVIGKVLKEPEKRTIKGLNLSGFRGYEHEF